MLSADGALANGLSVIVDTSALLAVLRREDAHGPILDALSGEPSLLPTPVLVEFARVTAGPGNAPDPVAERLLAKLLATTASVLPFGPDAARHAAAAAANAEHGTGNGRGGPLNLLDLMVLGCARATGRPILCTGRDFAAAGAPLHAASRGW